MSIDFGDGRDGDLTIISGTFNVNLDVSGSRSYADGIVYKVVNDPATQVISIGCTPNGIVAGDKVMLINLQGVSGDYADVGNYEILTILSTGSNYVTTTTIPEKSYDGTTFSNQKVVIQRIPQYGNITISGGGTLTTSAFDRLVTTPVGQVGYLSGIIPLMVSGSLLLDSTNDIIFGQGKGYIGGPTATTSKDYSWGYTGESTTGYSTSIATSSNASVDGGGGAGRGADGSGGGGGYGTAGINGGKTLSGSDYGRGASAFGINTLTRLYFGGGGGSAGSHTSSRIGAAGGAGGGIVYIHAYNIINRGYIHSDGVNGVDGTYVYNVSSGAGGGGGAGGSVYIKVYSLTSISAGISAYKGNGGAKASSSSSSPGGNGGVGRIRIDYTIVNDINYPDNSTINLTVEPDPYTERLELGWYYFSGYTKMTEVPVSRKLYCYRRDTGQLMSVTTSSGDGYFNVLTTHTGTHFIVALDDEDGANYNDLVVGNITPYYYFI